MQQDLTCHNFYSLLQRSVAIATVIWIALQSKSVIAQPSPANFSLGIQAISQPEAAAPAAPKPATAAPKPTAVIARLSVRRRTSTGYTAEQLIGDFRYTLNQQARFERGLNQGDRITVRLFDASSQFIGYSGFELLSENSAVTLVLPEHPMKTRIVRTIYGEDADRDLAIDPTVQPFDYFSQVTQFTHEPYRKSRVIFFANVQDFTLHAFTIASLPPPHLPCHYPTSFSSGAFQVVHRTLPVFKPDLDPAIAALPGQMTQPTVLSTPDISTYDVQQFRVSSPTGVDAKKPQSSLKSGQ